MKALEEFLKPTQRQLFKMLCKMFKGKTTIMHGKFILVRGETPIMLIAHLDTVHKEPVHAICASSDGNILMSPQGIGGDDRCGVYALVKTYELSAKKPWLLFTCDEEIGGIGADCFCQVHQDGGLPKELDELKCLIEIDRKGSNDAVYYDCCNTEFEDYITSKGFKTAFGTFSDISLIAPELGIAAVNLSSGYYNAHQLCEYINRAELDAVLYKVVEIVSDATKKNFPKYEYREKCCDDFRLYLDDYDKTEQLPKDLPIEYEELYYSLIEDFGYKAEKLEQCRTRYGNKIIYDLYVDESKSF